MGMTERGQEYRGYRCGCEFKRVEMPSETKRIRGQFSNNILPPKQSQTLSPPTAQINNEHTLQAIDL